MPDPPLLPEGTWPDRPELTLPRDGDDLLVAGVEVFPPEEEDPLDLLPTIEPLDLPLTEPRLFPVSWAIATAHRTKDKKIKDVSLPPAHIGPPKKPSNTSLHLNKTSYQMFYRA